MQKEEGKLQRGAAVAVQIKHNEVTEHWGTASALGTGGPERIGTELGNLEAGIPQQWGNVE